MDDVATKKEAAERLYRASRKLCMAVGLMNDAGALLSVLVGLGNQCEAIRALRAATNPIIDSLRKLEDADACDLDDTMKSILKQKAEGKRRAKKGAR